MNPRFAEHGPRGLLLMLALGILAVVLAGCAAGKGGQAPTSEATAPQVKSGFPDGDLTFIVPYAPGGSSDVIARLMTPYLPKYLPNPKANVIVLNQAGAGGELAHTQLWKANPDGKTIGFVNLQAAATNYILGKNSNYDMNKFTWLARVAESVYVVVRSPKVGFKTMDDLQKVQEVKVGAVGLPPLLILSKELGIKAKIITFDSSADIYMAMMRGDVDLTMFPYASLKRFIVDTKELIPMIVLAEERLSTLPDTPTAVEAGFPNLSKVIQNDFDIATSPAVSGDVAQVLEKALFKTMQDQQFLQDMAKAGWEVSPATAAETTTNVATYLQSLGKYKDILEQYSKK